MDPFIGEIRIFTGTYAPMGWMFCWGQTLQINQYTALYSLIGTQFGGDGATNFKLPDMRGRIPLCAGNGTNLTPRTQGQYGGYEKVQLALAEMPLHNHVIANTVTENHTLSVTGNGTIKCSNTSGNSTDPTSCYPAKTKSMTGDSIYTNDATKVTGNMSSDAVVLNGTVSGSINVGVNSACQNTGGTTAHENMSPWLCFNFIIAIEGIYPPRS